MVGDWRHRKKVEGGSAPTTNGKTGTLGRELIKHFEGCRLDSYLCPSSIWTVGVGHTGPDVGPGMHITQAEADRLLAGDLKRFEKAVTDLITVPLDQCEFDALVSFAFNTGSGALQESTLRKRLNKGDPKSAVFAEELPRWVNGANGPLEGLVRRRDAEVRLANDKLFP